MGDDQWNEAIEVDPIDVRLSVQTTADFNLDRNLKMIISKEMTPEIEEILAAGTPDYSQLTPEEENYAHIISGTIIERIIDKTLSPDMIRPYDLEIPLNPFIEGKAKLLSLRSTSENEILDDDPM